MKVLIVDDELDVEQLYRQRFRKEIKAGELNMMFAFSANQAMEFIAQLAPMDIVLVLSDINMPGLTGFDLLKFIREKYSHLKVVMVSAYGDPDNMNKASSLGASGFLVKPIDFTILKEKIFNLK